MSDDENHAEMSADDLEMMVLLARKKRLQRAMASVDKEADLAGKRAEERKSLMAKLEANEDVMLECARKRKRTGESFFSTARKQRPTTEESSESESSPDISMKQPKAKTTTTTPRTSSTREAKTTTTTPRTSSTRKAKTTTTTPRTSSARKAKTTTTPVSGSAASRHSPRATRSTKKRPTASRKLDDQLETVEERSPKKTKSSSRNKGGDNASVGGSTSSRRSEYFKERWAMTASTEDSISRHFRKLKRNIQDDLVKECSSDGVVVSGDVAGLMNGDVAGLMTSVMCHKEDGSTTNLTVAFCIQNSVLTKFADIKNDPVDFPDTVELVQVTDSEFRQSRFGVAPRRPRGAPVASISIPAVVDDRTVGTMGNTGSVASLEEKQNQTLALEYSDRINEGTVAMQKLRRIREHVQQGFAKKDAENVANKKRRGN